MKTGKFFRECSSSRNLEYHIPISDFGVKLPNARRKTITQPFQRFGFVMWHPKWRHFCHTTFDINVN